VRKEEEEEEGGSLTSGRGGSAAAVDFPCLTSILTQEFLASLPPWPAEYRLHTAPLSTRR